MKIRYFITLLIIFLVIGCNRNSAELKEEKNKMTSFLLSPYNGISVRDITWQIKLQNPDIKGNNDIRCFDFMKIDASKRQYTNVVSCYVLDKLHGPLMPADSSRYNQFSTGKIKDIRYVSSLDALSAGRVGDLTFSLYPVESTIPYHLEGDVEEIPIHHNIDDFTYHYDTTAYTENSRKSVDPAYQFASLPSTAKAVLPADQNSSGCYAETVKYMPTGRFLDYVGTPDYVVDKSGELYSTDSLPQDDLLYTDKSGNVYKNGTKLSLANTCDKIAHKFLGVDIDKSHKILDAVVPVLDAELETFLNACNYLDNLRALKQDPDLSKGYFYVPSVNKGTHDYYFKEVTNFKYKRQ